MLTKEKLGVPSVAEEVIEVADMMMEAVVVEVVVVVVTVVAGEEKVGVAMEVRAEEKAENPRVKVVNQKLEVEALLEQIIQTPMSH